MAAFYDLLRSHLARDGALAVATIIGQKGSVPCEAGAKMLVSPRGEIAGSIGGGRGESLVCRDALDVLRSGRPTITRVDLAESLADQGGTSCGGVMEVFVERLAPDEAPAGGGPSGRALLERIEQAKRLREPAVLATVVGGEAAPLGTRLLAVARGDWLGPAAPWVGLLEEPIADTLSSGVSRRVRLLGDASLDVFLEAIPPAPDLVIVGAGHIARPLASIGKLLEFEITVVDDRADYASATRFPDADRVVVDDLVAAVTRHPIGPSTYVVLVTREHRLGEQLLRAVIRSDAAYIGMIGSRRRVAALLDHLRRLGIPGEAVARVHAPIGLDIGADTPAEIAVAIAAEIVNVRRGGRARPMSARPRHAGA